ncbi:MAG: High-affinity branched-chain amino acid transport ATP-binding protein LivF [Dehalococcoidia bacterium]|nr:High-affinity branched-chain amino acid transport ATP-binding protein LivF [Bacillota bacterium]
MLVVKGVDIYYGKLQVLWDLSLQVGKESVGLFGPNGAGKTTLVNAIVGLVKPANGEITFGGRSLLPLETHRIIREGVAVVPQERELFPFMSVLGNLKSGAAYIPGARDKIDERMRFIFDIFPVLKERLGQLAVTLSGGEQRMLAIARSLMAGPKLLILDEPSSGLQPSLVSDLFRRMREIREKEGVSILIAEQNVRQCLRAIDRGYVIENGRVVIEDSAEGLAHSDHVRRSYLGL